MKTNINKKNTFTRELSVTVPWASLENDFKKEFDSLNDLISLSDIEASMKLCAISDCVLLVRSIDGALNPSKTRMGLSTTGSLILLKKGVLPICAESLKS